MGAPVESGALEQTFLPTPAMHPRGVGALRELSYGEGVRHRSRRASCQLVNLVSTVGWARGQQDVGRAPFPEEVEFKLVQGMLKCREE